MSDWISQDEAEQLLKEKKYRIDNTKYVFPATGGILNIPLKTKKGDNDFFLDVRKGKIGLKKNTFQTRVKTEIILARIDLGGPPHRNPDGKEILCPHLHLYRENFGDKWARSLPNQFTNPNDFWQTLEEFMNYCNIVEKPLFEK